MVSSGGSSHRLHPDVVAASQVNAYSSPDISDASAATAPVQSSVPLPPPDPTSMVSGLPAPGSAPVPQPGVVYPQAFAPFTPASQPAQVFSQPAQPPSAPVDPGAPAESKDSRWPLTYPARLGYPFAGLGLALVFSTVISVLSLVWFFATNPQILSDPSALASSEQVMDFALSAPVIIAGILALWAGFLSVLFFVSRRRGAKSFAKDFLFRFAPVDLAWGVGLAVVGFAGQLILLSGFTAVGVDLEGADNSSVILGHSPAATAVLALCIGLGAPVVEELFFRGLTLGVFAARFSPAIGVLVSSALFGLMHAGGSTQLGAGTAVLVLVTGLMGLLFALVTVRTRRLGPAVVGHVVFNSTTVVLVLSGLA